jgi:heavy metal sensor kinase
LIPISIRWKLTLWYGAALSVVLIFFSAATYWRYRAAAWKAFDADLAINLETLRSALVEELREGNAESEPSAGTLQEGHAAVSVGVRAATDALEEFRLNGLYAEVRQGSAAETLLARRPAENLGSKAGLLPDSIWRESARSDTTRLVPAGPGARAAIRSFRLSPGGEPIELAVAGPTTLVEATLASIRRSLVEFGTLGLVLALAGGYWLATRTLRPIDAMTTRAAHMAASPSSMELQGLPVSNSGDELDRLARTFNRLLERIASSVSQLKGFIADAAHELKTPVAIIRAEAELALSAERSLGDYRDALGTIAAESQRLSLIVGDLTLLAEGETLDHPLERRLVDLKELTEEVSRSLRAVAAGRRVVVRIESSGSAEYRGDERLLRQVVTNLLENAIKFSRSPGCIDVVLSKDRETVELRVLDEAPTLSPADRDNVFDRFYRTPQSRSSEAAGTGLGLAIVRWAVTLHGGRVRVEPREPSGNAFIVTLPQASEPSEA